VPDASTFANTPLAEIADGPSTVEPGNHRSLVLVVDDESVIADTLVAILTSQGHAAMAVYDAESALDLANSNPPALLISDVMLPGMNGLDLAIAIRKKVPDCRVLLFSGHAASQELLAIAREAGHDFSFLAKPIHPGDLLSQISLLNPNFGRSPVP
jgi:CheY-like chemotaxis protein